MYYRQSDKTGKPRMRKRWLLVPVMILSLIATVYAVYTVSLSQNITVKTPFSVSVQSSSPGVLCTGATSIVCTGLQMNIGDTEILTVNGVLGSATTFSCGANTSNANVATISPTSQIFTASSLSQTFTVTAIGGTGSGEVAAVSLTCS